MSALYRFAIRNSTDVRRSTSSSDDKKQDGPAEDGVPRDSDEDAPQPHEAQDQPTDRELERAEARRRRIYRWKIICGLTPCQVLAALDATIVSTALVKISLHFNELNQFDWIVTTYTLCSTTFIPMYGQIANVFGRHAALQFSMICMLIGSVLATAAQNYPMLLLGRAFQGVSAAGINNLVKIVLADKVTLAEQSKNTTIFSLVSGFGFSLGPVIGGYMTQANWRLCFVLSIPISLIASILIFFLLRDELVKGEYPFNGPNRKSLLAAFSTFDYGGMILFIFGTGLIMLGVSYGGVKYPWNSPSVVLPLVIGSLLFVLFFVYEYFLESDKGRRLLPTRVPMIPWSLFGHGGVALLAVIGFATGASFYSAIYFVGIFWTLVQNDKPGMAGLRILLYIPGIGIGSYIAMFLCNYWPRQTFYPLFVGSVIEAGAFSGLAYATKARSAALVSVLFAIAGGGAGARQMPGTLHAAAIWRDRIASVMSLMDFTLPFGGTISIAMMSSVFYNEFAKAVAAINDENIVSTTSRNSTSSLQQIDALPSATQTLLREGAARGVMYSFISVTPIMAVAVVAASVLGNAWISPKKKTGREASKGAVMYTSFLWAVFTGTMKAKKVDVNDTTDIPQDEGKRNEKRVAPGGPEANSEDNR